MTKRRLSLIILSPRNNPTTILESTTVGRPPKPIDETTYSGRFAARLRILREAAGLTVEEMAVAISNAGHACTKKTYHNWEAGIAEPSFNSLPAIASVLNLGIRTIFPMK